jgi:hypothetical protein
MQGVASNQQRFGAAHYADERIDRDIHRGDEAVARAIHDPRLLWTKRDGTQADIDLTPSAADAVKQRSKLAFLAHIEQQHDIGPEFFGDRAHERLGFRVLKRDRELCALHAECLGATED